MSWYTLDDTANDYAMEKFSIARDREKLIPFIKEALKVKPDLHLWASPWVLPSWMLNGGNMKTDAQTLKAHALYLARFVEEYAKEGMKIEAVHFQNEPGYGRVRGWTRPALHQLRQDATWRPSSPSETSPPRSGAGPCQRIRRIPTSPRRPPHDAEAMKIVKGFGLQWNLQAAVATLAHQGSRHADGAHVRQLQLRHALLGQESVQREQGAERSPLRRGKLAAHPRLDRRRA